MLFGLLSPEVAFETLRKKKKIVKKVKTGKKKTIVKLWDKLWAWRENDPATFPTRGMSLIRSRSLQGSGARRHAWWAGMS